MMRDALSSDYPWHLESNLLYFGAPQMEVSQIVAVRVWLPARTSISRTSVMSSTELQEVCLHPGWKGHNVWLAGTGCTCDLRVSSWEQDWLWANAGNLVTTDWQGFGRTADLDWGFGNWGSLRHSHCHLPGSHSLNHFSWGLRALSLRASF